MVADGQIEPEGNEQPEGSDQGLGSSRIRWAVAIGTLAAISIYIGYVVHNEDIRRDYFVQRLTTVILILGVVVVLFVLFKTLINLQIPIQIPIVAGPMPQVASGGAITLIGAGALLWLLLGPVKNLIFPPDQVFSGNIYYKLNEGGEPLEPVKDVIVQIPETDQKSQPSSEDGRFTITNLTFHPEDVNALYGGRVYPFEPGKYQHSRYDVINRPAIPPKTMSSSIAPTEWTESGYKCTGVNTAGYSKVALFVLQKSVPWHSGYPTLVIKVNVRNTLIIDAQKEKPDSQGNEDQLTTDRTIARQWSLPALANPTEVKLTLCLARKGNGPPPARNDITTEFWFEK